MPWKKKPLEIYQTERGENISANASPCFNTLSASIFAKSGG
jgi:hypothetical protein